MPRSQSKKVHCSGKLPFDNHQQAVWNLARLCERTGASMDGWNVYQCRFCGKFHRGHRGFHGSRDR